MAVFAPAYEVKDFVPVLRALPEAIEANLGPALQDCRGVLLNDISSHFADRENSDGSAWPPRKDNEPHPLLILSSLMFQSAAGNAAGAVDRLSGNTLEIGVDKSAVRYAGVHQFGYAPRNIPKREYLWISDEAEQKCVDLVAAHLQGMLFG